MTTQDQAVAEAIMVTRSELVTLRDAEQEYARAVRRVNEAEQHVKPLRLALAEKVLGIKTSDELKALPPEDIEKLMAKRLREGLWEAVRGAPRFKFVKVSSGRYPAWKAEFVAVCGEVKAETITAASPSVYSYRIEIGS